MKAGDKIRVFTYIMGHITGTKDFTVEEFRHCLGFFASDNDKTAGYFTPLCDLYDPGPESKTKYISNYGEYITNKVQAWMDINNNDEQPWTCTKCGKDAHNCSGDCVKDGE